MDADRSATNLHSNVSGQIQPNTLGLDYDGHDMVFVVGCPRSGTTWAHRLLACHPQIRTGQESHVFHVHIGPQLRSWRKLADPKRNRGGVGLSCYFTEEEFFRILKAYLLTLIEPMVAHLGPRELFLEKSPPHVLFLPEIFELLPNARVIHVLRDARDVVSSLLSGDEWCSWWAPEKASDAADIWAGHIKAFRDALPKIPRERIHEIRYESLSESPVAVLRQCVDFLGLEWDLADIAKAVDANMASRAKASGGGTPIPLFGEAAKHSGPVVVEPKNFIRKAQAGAWETDLSWSQKFWVWRKANNLMEEMDYHWPAGMESAFSLLSSSIDIYKGTSRRKIQKNSQHKRRFGGRAVRDART